MYYIVYFLFEIQIMYSDTFSNFITLVYRITGTMMSFFSG